MTRDALDRYFTPPEFAEAAVAMLDDYCVLEGQRCLEPHVGAGSFASALLRRPIESLHTIDIDPDCEWTREPQEFLAPGFCLTHAIADFLKWSDECCDPFDIAAGNPPFSDAELHLRATYRLLSPRGVMGFVLPLHFLGSSGRREFYRELMPTEIQTIRPRIPFAQEMREMGFYIWDKQAMGLGRRHFTMSWIDWTPTKKPRKPREYMDVVFPVGVSRPEAPIVNPRKGEIGTVDNGREDTKEEQGNEEADGETAEGSPEGEPIRAGQDLAQVVERLNEGETVVCRQDPTAAEVGRGEGSTVSEGTALHPDDS